MEQCEDVRHTLGMKKLYEQRKETIERIFGTAKENHGFRYTQMYGKARMEMKVGLTFACMNLKKLAMMLQKIGRKGCLISTFLSFWANDCCKQRKMVLGQQSQHHFVYSLTPAQQVVYFYCQYKEKAAAEAPLPPSLNGQLSVISQIFFFSINSSCHNSEAADEQQSDPQPLILLSPVCGF